MIVNSNGTRYSKYVGWSTEKYKPYNYERDGLLVKCMSRKITETKNTILRSYLDFFERSLIFLMNMTDYLKHFKDICWKNR